MRKKQFISLGAVTPARLTAVGAAVAVLFWTAESLMHLTAFGGEGFIGPFLNPDAHELWMRLLVIVIIAALLTGFYFIIARQKTLETRVMAERALRLNAEWFSATLRSIGEALVATDRNGNITYINNVASDILGIRQKAAAGIYICDIVKVLDERTEKPVDAHCASAMETGETTGLSTGILVTGSGGRMNIEYSLMPLKDGNGAIVGAVMVFRDTTKAKGTEKALMDSERFLNTIFGSIRDPFSIIDRNYNIVKANEAYAQLKKTTVSALAGQTCYRALYGRETPCDHCVVEKTFISGDPCAKEKHLVMEDGSHMWVEIYTYPIADSAGNITHVAEYTRDITDRKRAEHERERLINELAHLSRTDSMTGVLNRRAIIERTDYEIARCRRSGKPLSMVLCDIDRFKDINDTFGHDVGDMLLVTIAEALGIRLRATDIIGRYGGDEFIILLPETDIESAALLAEELRAALKAVPFEHAADTVGDISLSFGVSSLAESDANIDPFVKRADIALYRAKNLGRDRVATIEASD